MFLFCFVLFFFSFNFPSWYQFIFVSFNCWKFNLTYFSHNYDNYSMFLDVPECSGMFRNVPCSIFYRRPYLFKVSYVLFRNCSVVLFTIFVSFRSLAPKINCTALPCLFFVISFRCCWVEFPRRYRSCLLAQGNISRLAWCLVRIVLKLTRFRKPTFMVLKSGAWCK